CALLEDQMVAVLPAGH
ncbi:hypothetical protein MKD33_20265, partial [Chromobacterium piscinae]